MLFIPKEGIYHWQLLICWQIKHLRNVEWWQSNRTYGASASFYYLERSTKWILPAPISPLTDDDKERDKTAFGKIVQYAIFVFVFWVVIWIFKSIVPGHERVNSAAFTPKKAVFKHAYQIADSNLGRQGKPWNAPVIIVSVCKPCGRCLFKTLARPIDIVYSLPGRTRMRLFCITSSRQSCFMSWACKDDEGGVDGCLASARFRRTDPAQLVLLGSEYCNIQAKITLL